MKKRIMSVMLLFLSLFVVCSCTPLVVGTAAVGGAAVGYALRDEGYTIRVTKQAPGEKKKTENSTAPTSTVNKSTGN